MKSQDDRRGRALPGPAAPALPRRQKLRLPDYDYAAPAYYFVTICTEERRCVLGYVAEDIVVLSPVLSPVGSAVHRQWTALPKVCEGIALDHFVVMPNHLHALLTLRDRMFSLPQAIGAFKSLSTKAVNRLQATPGAGLWQRGYHDHVVRDEIDLARIREYIANNPLKWHLDRENPAHAPRAAPGRAEPGPYD